MILFPYELGELYHQDRIAEADHYRLLKQIRVGEPNLLGHLFSKINHFPAQVKQILAGLTQVEVRFEGWLRNKWIH